MPETTFYWANLRSQENRMLKVSLITHLNICIIKLAGLFILEGHLFQQLRDWEPFCNVKSHKQLQCKSQCLEPIKIKAVMLSATNFIT